MKHLAITCVACAAVACGPAFSAPARGRTKKPGAIGDKTLVVWVYLANLDQRGGGALTIQNPAGQFDAIVLGEVQDARWMPASESLKRTRKDQADWPEETAKPKTPVQIAIVYKGQEVRIYRNGKPYAAYTIWDRPAGFTQAASTVVMGVHHLGEDGKQGFFGSIDDARIYSTALTAEQIAALKPNKPGKPKPLAWWTFDDAGAADKMGTFPKGRLVGKARIAGGRLQLAGGYLLAGAPPAAAKTKVLFADSFDGKLGEGWHWLRQDAKAWRIKDGGLEIRVQPGVNRNVRNALLRPAPDRKGGKVAIDVTVTSHTRPTVQYEQAGITLYHNGRPGLKLVKELINGKLYIIPGKKPMKAKTVQLRLVIEGSTWTAQYRPDAKGEFLTAGKGRLPAPGKDHVSIQCYNGPPDAVHWIRFDDFSIVKLPD